MDQDETQATAPDTSTEALVTEEPADETSAELADERKGGRVLQTFLVRVTLRANDDGTEGSVPTNERLADVVETAIYQQIEDFERYAINATAEKV